MYTCLCITTHTCMCIHIHIHVYNYTYTYTYTHTHMYVRACVYLYIRKERNTNTMWTLAFCMGSYVGHQDAQKIDPILREAPNIPLIRALWSLLDGIWGLLKGSWGVLAAYTLSFGRLGYNVWRTWEGQVPGPYKYLK